MSQARDAIFAALGPSQTQSADILRHADALLDRVAALRPNRVGDDLADSFLARVTGPVIGASGQRVTGVESVPDAVRAYLLAQDQPPSLALQPHAKLLSLDWSGIETHHAIAVDEAVAVCFAPYAVAETGSLVFRSGADMPVLFAFLPLHHIVVVDAASVVAWLEDCAAIEASRATPRNLNLVTGASGTTDIEGALVRGAHGPAQLHIILVDPVLPPAEKLPSHVPATPDTSR